MHDGPMFSQRDFEMKWCAVENKSHGGLPPKHTEVVQGIQRIIKDLDEFLQPPLVAKKPPAATPFNDNNQQQRHQQQQQQRQQRRCNQRQ